ncbi:MAG: hypothetical protein P8180_11585 [Gammaproteobacteria bacterium]|jgi:hypothetical protein
MNANTRAMPWYVHVAGLALGTAAAVLFPQFLPPHTAAWDVYRYTANTYGVIGLGLGLAWPRLGWHWAWWLGLPLLAFQGVGALAGRGAMWATPHLLRLLIALFTGGVGSQFGAFLGSKLRPAGPGLESQER